MSVTGPRILTRSARRSANFCSTSARSHDWARLARSSASLLSISGRAQGHASTALPSLTLTRVTAVLNGSAALDFQHGELVSRRRPHSPHGCDYLGST
jgi:hypothetical protein